MFYYSYDWQEFNGSKFHHLALVSFQAATGTDGSAEPESGRVEARPRDVLNVKWKNADLTWNQLQ